MREKDVTVARRFRKQSTDTEDVLWQALRHRRILGRKFRRQHPIGRYFLDFYCHEEKLAVEIDGPIHDHQKEHDEVRQETIEKLGIRFVRLKSEDVETKLSECLAAIEKALTPVPSPARRERGGEQRETG